jgi:hypothetical protein
VLAATTTAALAAPTSATPAEKGIWGPVRLPDGSSAFPVYKELGAEVLEVTLDWSSTARRRPANPRDPKDPAYSWPADLDEAVTNGARYGIKLLVIVQYAPGWANGGRAQQWGPRRVSDYADFLTAASRRYGSVRRWMIWGEPSANYKPMPLNRPTGPRSYAKLLDAAYVALKKRSRGNLVIGGNSWTAGVVLPRDFVRWMRLPSGRPPRLDLYGHNPFSYRFPRLSDPATNPGVRDMSDVDTLYGEVCSAYRPVRRRCPRLWLSEFTVSSDRGNRAFEFFVSRKDQARWLTTAYRIANRTRYIAGLGWFNLHDEPATQPYGLTTGLMTYEGTRKPAFYAYRRVR